MPTIGNVLWLTLLWSTVAHAEVSIPVIGRPSSFSGAAGTGVKIEATAEPIEFTPTQGTTYTLTIRSLLNAADVPRPDLRERPEFRKDFQVEPDLSPMTEPDGTRLFRYHLRPHRPDITLIPAVEFTYYDPTIPQPVNQPSLPFRKTRAGAIAIRIRPDETPPPRVPIPLDIPAFAEQPVSSARVEIGHRWWLVVLVLGPLGTLAIAGVWRLLDPASLRAVRRRRSRMTRQVLKQIHRLTDEPAAAELMAILAGYWALRYGGSRWPYTPSELHDLLAKAHVPAADAQPLVDLFRALDEFRFAPTHAHSWSAILARTIQLLDVEDSQP